MPEEGDIFVPAEEQDGPGQNFSAFGFLSGQGYFNFSEGGTMSRDGSVKSFCLHRFRGRFVLRRGGRHPHPCS